ncbi:hypothetical protein K438DRAFT_1836496 [Mycena galopus ATCC 62051]|nr:hypothetical protein K438DRAFT_1899406 [Mycena galopus ATCC 62051]KAF8120679.1 hypothetical protein K438DRAFT_1899410 [Mycena galopus ATCC 62051]KAF8185906.1 hypothetical protein K438DRAFT_1836485 [Mycena galopus ATCC 62051]KAF8185913.1 hypothetical protein K438DRAFT_1836496 [Mycena galopus ATCC 62051]
MLAFFLTLSGPQALARPFPLLPSLTPSAMLSRSSTKALMGSRSAEFFSASIVSPSLTS